MQKFLAICFIIVCLPIVFADVSIAQEEGETLSHAVEAPSNEGFYKVINSLPESVRRSSAFARILHDLRRNADKDGYINVEARLASIEQSKADLVRDNAIAYKSSNSKLPIFAD